MGTKRKAKEAESDRRPVNRKKVRHDKRISTSDLIFAPRPDWHAAALPALQSEDAAALPPQHAINELRDHANSLLERENVSYNASNGSSTASHKFLSTIMASGTLEDKVSALTLLVQESPLHNTKTFESLVNLSRKKGRSQALMALAAVKDLLGRGSVLPDRKLKAFDRQPALAMALGTSGRTWKCGDVLPGGLQEIHLVVWAFEDWLKRTYFELLQILESWCSDEIEYSRTRALTYIWELLKDKPEQEDNLLRLLVNKLGDTDRKIASRASYLLLQLQTAHPAMKSIVTSSIEADCLFRPGQSAHAKYYAIITLNQTILSQKEQTLASKLLNIYFSLFVQLLKPLQPRAEMENTPARQQGGGGKAGKQAHKKRRAQERDEEANQQLHERMVAQVLTGVNRAFPFADTADPTFEKQIDTLFRVTHSANFNTAIQALMLIQQISSTKHYSAERYYRTLYESLLDPRLVSSSKQIMYLNLLYKSLKADVNARRVQAFVKRLLQVITMHEPPFVCGVLFMISELESSFPSIRSMITQSQAADSDDDEEEHFQDVDETPTSLKTLVNETYRPTTLAQYDAKKRDPEHSLAHRSCLWDLLPSVQHFHPSVSLFATSILAGHSTLAKPDPTKHTLGHFLDRFVYRTARTKTSASTHGSSIFQPLAGSDAADLLVTPGKGATFTSDVNSEQFWRKQVQDVEADEVFFHAYFNQVGKAKKRTTAKATGSERDDVQDSDESGEDEIWKAITASKPEVDGDDEDGDLSFDDLESAYSQSDRDSEAGIDLGGSEGDDDAAEANVMLEHASERDSEDDLPELDSEEGGFESLDEDDLRENMETLDQSRDEGISNSKKQRKAKKKLKSLPTFASAEDYARLLQQEDEEEEFS